MSLRDLAKAAGISEADEELLALLLAEEGVELEEAETIPRRPDAASAPLSFAQERLWFIDRLDPGSPLYNMPSALRLRGPFRPAVLAACLREILCRHESLRTRFEERDGAPVQVIDPLPAAAPVPLVDLSGLPEGARRAVARRLAREEARRPFDLARGPLLRAAVLRLTAPGAGPDAADAGEEHALLFTLHHIVSDGWSMGVLTREVAALYGAFAAGRPSPLPAPAIQYADFAAWQRGQLQGEALAAELDHWRRELAGAPVLELPADRPRPARPTLRGGVRAFSLPAAVSRALQDLSQREGATLFMTLLAGLDALLYRYTGQTDVVAGSMIANRNRREIEGLIGFFVNALALRVDLGGDPSFRELLGRARETSLAAFAHQDLPFEKLVAEIQPGRDLGRSPLFQVVLLVQNAPAGGLELPGLSLRGFDPGEEGGGELAKFDLLLTVVEGPQGIAGSFSYAADLFDPPTIARLGEHLATLLAGAAADPDRRLSRLPLLGPGERHQLTVEWARTRSVTIDPGETIAGRFRRQVAQTPDAPAVEGEDGALTYAQLAERAGRLARGLRSRGLCPEQPVALCLERSVALVAATVAVLEAGGVYLPLDPALPDERLRLLLDDAGRALGRPLVVAGDGDVERFAALLGPGWTVLSLPALEAEPAADAGPAPALPADALAYVMYTSGSTGQPKGVAVPHRAVLRLVGESWWASLGPGEVFLQLAPASFDAATLEIWAPLLNGGRLVVFPAGPPSLEALGDVIARRGVTTLWLTAGLFHQMVEGNLRGLAPLRQLLAGGDVLSPAHVDRVLRELPHLCLINGYGPTENTTFTCCWPLERAAREPGAAVPIGRPIQSTSVRLLDRDGNPVPAGIPGELWTGGDGLARGYLGRADLTAERFAPGPQGGRLYRTGDLARFRRDGAVEFLGRADQQVKIRGFRIEPGEIEAVLLGHPAVRQAAVLALDDGLGGKRLAGFVAPRAGAGLEAGALRDFLRGRLPDYMVPAAWDLLGELPLNANGKIDRRALAVRAAAPAAGRGEEAAAPRTPVEELMAGAWCDVLGRPRVGVADDFFELGGHSLLATRLVSRLREVFGVELPVRAVFEAPTVAALAREVEQALAQGAGLAAPPIRPVGRDRELPLSFAQERLWFLAQLEPESPAYNVPTVLRFSGRLDAGALAGALSAVVARHEVLRTTFAAGAEGPVQVIAPPRPAGWPVVDLSALPAAQREPTARRLAARESARPFDLARGPLLRALLLRLEPRQHVAVLNLHHVVTDGWSMGVLVRELGSAYGALLRGEEPRLPALPVQYADFAVWQRAWLAGEVLATQLAYWRERLAGAPALLDLPLDRPRPPVQTVRGDAVALALPDDLSQSLLALGRERGVTLFMVLLAAWQALLSRYSGQESVVVGSPVANRNRAEIEPLIGFFVNTLALRVDLGGEPDFLTLLARAREATLGAYAHQDLPFERLVEDLQPERSLGSSPLFQVMLALQNAPQGGIDLPAAGDDRLELAALEPEGVAAKFDLSLGVAEAGRGIRGTLVFNRDLFDRATAERWAGHLQSLLAAVAADPGRVVADVPVMAAAESAQVLAEWNQTAAVALPHRLLHRWVEEQATRTPEAVAVIDGRERWSYRRLDEEANRLAHLLRLLGVGPEALVAVCAGRAASLVAALLGVLKAGGAYVGLDPRYPRERLAFMLADAGARVLLTEQRFLEILPEHRIPTVRLDADRDLIEQQSSRRPGGAEPAPENLAYLIYTSGSTGRPKGVAIAHASAAMLVGWAGEVFPPESLAGVLAATSVCFDLSVFELFVPLAHGGAVIVAEDALALPAHPAAAEVTLVNTVPSALAELVRQGALPASVRTVNLAGEALQRELVEAIYRTGTVREVCNLYGPSEDTTYSTWTRVARGERRPPAIGRPLAATRVYLADRRLRPVPLGVPGELLLGGAGLARGYLGRPELTAERFVPDPFGRGERNRSGGVAGERNRSGGVAGERLYKTGDLARYRPDGDLEYLGRLDHQVKVRGFRIELGEIEAALLALPEVLEAAVLAREDHPGERTLVAYVVPAGAAASAGELAARLRQRLPDFMVPSFFVPLAALPLTPNGKLDRKALPAPERPLAGGDGPIGSEPPRTPVEEVLAEIWADLLRLGRDSRIGLRANFFALGGHSLLATRLASRLREALGVELPLRRLFEVPTLAGQAAEIEAARRAGAPPAPPLRRVRRDQPLPLSFAQERLWFLDQFEPGRAAYNVPTALRFEGPLDVGLLAASFREVARRHEALRTTFVVVEGRAVQVVAPAPDLQLPLIDLAGVPEAAREREVSRIAAAESWRPFDLAAGPLVRGRVLRLAPDDHAVLFAMHHIVSDGWSMGILVREVAALYGAFARGLPSPLPELPVQYPDFAAWQRGWLAGEVLQGQLGWWRERLAGAPPVLDLPLDRPRPPVHTLRGERRTRQLSPAVGRALAELGRANGATPFMVLLAAWKAFLVRHTGQRDLVVGTPIANRTRAEVEGLIGFFVNTLVLRTEVPAEERYPELLALVRETALGAYDHQDVPFEKLVEEIAPERNLRHTPLFQVMFVFEEGGGAERGAAEGLPGLTLRPLNFENRTAKFDLTLIVNRQGDGLQLLLGYNTALFRGDSIERMLDHLVQLLEGIAEAPDRKVLELPLLGAAERHQLVSEWNDTAGAVPAGLLHGQFEEWARRRPEAPALVLGEREMSYGELEERSGEVAAVLRGLGVGPEVRVGLCLERSFELLVGLLGVLRAGGAYVPLDPANPAERLRFQVEDARAPVLLTQRSLAASFQVGREVAVVCLDEALPQSRRLEGAAPDPDGLAYVIYTSGSTGTPNGVLVPHRGAVNLIREARDLYRVGPESRILQTASVGFDASVLEIFLALSHGASLCLVREEERLTPSVLTRRLVEQGVSTAVVTPSLLSVLPEESLGVLRSVSVGGEACSAELAARWARDGRRLLNCYGPTEATIFATVEVMENLSGEVEPLIGRPVANARAYVVDAGLAPVPVGVAGELVLGGVGLARGYLDRPEKTASKFVPDAFSGEEGARLYRTGDLVRFRADGRIEFLGRIDDQVKVRGFRIELGEIEAALLAHPDVASAVVLAPPDKTGARRLVAYVTAREGRELAASDLRRFLETTLPDYMVPAHVLVLEAMPVTPGGKVDRRALPNPEGDPQSGRAYIAPRTPAERFVAELWQQVLGVERISALDDFFALGGSSIKGALLTNLLQERLGEYVYVVALFDAPTLEKLAAYLLKTYPEAMARVTGMRVEERRDERRVDAGMLLELRDIIPPLVPYLEKESAQNARAAFILSPPRSGSTLLRVMLAGNPALFAPPELELLGFNTLEERKSVFTGRWELWTEGTIRALMEVFACDADEARRRMAEYESKNLSIREFYGELQKAIGGRLLVDKTPSYSLDAATLQRAEEDFERPLYIHLLRHPYGMIRSFEKAKLEQVFFRPEHPFSRRQLAELIYGVCHENIVAHLSRIDPQRHLQVRFEDLVKDPRAELERLCSFLDVPFDERMLDPYSDSSRKMTDGIHALSKMVGDVKFHQHKAVDAKVAETWRDEVREDFLGDVTWDLAARLGYAERASRPAFSPLVRLNEGEPGRRPLFLVHPVGGNVLCYAELARSLGPELPVYGLQSVGLDAGQTPQESVEEMAATYLEALRSVQPHGPFRLGGWSIGGVIAFEMARQARRAGEEVELLALVDTTRPDGRAVAADEAEMLADAARDLGGLAGRSLDLDGAALRELAPGERLQRVLERAHAAGALPAEFGLDLLCRLWDVYRANTFAVARYSAAPQDGRVLLVTATGNPGRSRRGEALGWEGLGDLEIETLAAGHYGLLRPPVVQTLAGWLRSRIAELEGVEPALPS